jgi:hypothetical protein
LCILVVLHLSWIYNPQSISYRVILVGLEGETTGQWHLMIGLEGETTGQWHLMIHVGLEGETTGQWHLMIHVGLESETTGPIGTKFGLFGFPIF